MHRYENFGRYPIILYIWKQITDMFADKSISKYVYTFWDPDFKKGLIIKSHIPNTSTKAA